MKSLLVLLCGMGVIASEAPPVIDLSGDWQLALDPGDTGLAAGPAGWRFDDSITLPATLASAGKGQPLAREPKLDKETLQHLHPRFSYVGPAWYQRTIDIPVEWAGRDARLTLERVLWESRVWVNGREAGMRDSLSTPHRYEVGELLEPGKLNTLTIRIDNRKKIDIGIGHAYSEETQTIWNGVVGRIELESRPKARVESLRVRPTAEASTLAVTVRLENTGAALVDGGLAVRVLDPAGATLATHERSVRVGPGGTDLAVTLRPETAPPRWCEFEPVVCRVVAEFKSHAGDSSLETAAGFRRFSARDRGLFINDRPVFLRGTLECCIFPRTGHPDMDGNEWTKIMRTVRDYGLNHIRFHSWCPPRAAFDAADRHGVYLQVELPNWSFHMGLRPEVDAFFRLEGERLLHEYGNHPSFVLFCLGNELTGDFAAMDRMLEAFQEIEPDLLMTSTSFSFSERGKTPGPADAFFISQETASGWVRGQGFLNQIRPNTAGDYAAGLASVPVPLVTHEVGQYNNYPNLAELPKYDGGALRSLAYEAIRDDLAAKGLLGDAARFTRDSGKLAVLLYKEDLERAMRTKGLAGIQLLDLHDFPGQSTATVGVLDAFWDSKGLVTAGEFRRFAGPTVPLARMDKLLWDNDETFTARVEIAHFGAAPLRDSTVCWQVTGEDGRVLGEARWPARDIPWGNGIPLGNIQLPLHDVIGPERLELTVAVTGTQLANSWSFWVYPKEDPGVDADNCDVVVLDTPDPALGAALAAGRRVLLTPPRAALATPIDARFIPVFWSPLHFPNQPGTLGATIDSEHPVFRLFPTGTHTDWQWWELFATSQAMDLIDLPAKPAMPLRFVDKFNRNALPAAIWEARIGPGRLLVCTLDIANDLEARPAARQLRRSVMAYVTGDDFQPELVLEPEVLDGLFREVRFKVSASGFHHGYRPEAAVDGDPATFWHTDWEGNVPQLPAWLAIDLGEPRWVSGLAYTPRQDMDRGRIARYRVEVSDDAKQWHAVGGDAAFPNSPEPRTIPIEPPVQVRHIRLTGLSDHGRADAAAIAELAPVVQ